jgi:lipopolysaccharide assembly protein A
VSLLPRRSSGAFARVFKVLIVLFLVLAVATFVLENQQSVTLSFLGSRTPDLAVSAFMILFLIVGMIVGPVIAVVLKASRRRD